MLKIAVKILKVITVVHFQDIDMLYKNMVNHANMMKSLKRTMP